MSKIKKDNESVEIERIVEFILSPTNSFLNVIEACDYYYEENLTKEDVDELIKALQELRDKMK